MTIAFSRSHLNDDPTSGSNDRYRLDRLPETKPSSSVFDRC